MRNPINVQHIKNYFSSKVVLVIAILSIVPIVLGFVTAFSYADLSSQTQSIVNLYGEGSNFRNNISLPDTGSFNLSGIAVVVGWFLIYFLSKSKNPDTTPAAGLMIFTVLSIIGIVGASLLMLVGIILLIVSLAIGGSSGTATFNTYGSYDTYSSNASVLTVVLVILAIILLIAGVISLIASILQLKFFNAPRKSMKSPFLYVAGKGYGVISIIRAVFIFISAVSLLIFGFYFLSIPRSALEGINSEIPIRQMQKLLSPIGQIMIIYALSAIIQGVTDCLQAKLAFGYSKLASSTPTQPVNVPYGGGGYGFYGQDNNQPGYYNETPQYQNPVNQNYQQQATPQYQNNNYTQPQNEPVNYDSQYGDGYQEPTQNNQDDINYNPYNNQQ